MESAARPAADHKARKRSHINTQALCEAQVVEAPSLSGPAAPDETKRLFQALRIELQRENASAVLRRSSEAAGLGRHLADP